MQGFELRSLCPEDRDAFIRAVNMVKAETPPWAFAFHFDPAGEFSEYVRKLERWSRGLDLPDNTASRKVACGKKDGIPQLRYKQERAEFIEYSRPVFNSNTVFFYNKEKFPKGFSRTGMEAVQTYRIGSVESHSVSEYSKAREKEKNRTMKLINNARK